MWQCEVVSECGIIPHGIIGSFYLTRGVQKKPDNQGVKGASFEDQVESFLSKGKVSVECLESRFVSDWILVRDDGCSWS
ncbi:hypothetical protein L1987_00901 [Smallanthus sonchifolius]|uniref:Uncharacterized protein n=1 Tax=Smallanthus sonchifolius TaxID=185202 RepID=A0ACB9K3I8_9ASTR|nr:hypothetical protein L1987_00901 [Smallanthus sonchifolius]